MEIEQVFLQLHKRIGFFTKETASRVPESAGVYAWFIPLWIYVDDIDDLFRGLHSIYNYDTTCTGTPVANAQAPLGWESLDIRVRKDVQRGGSVSLREQWEQARADVSLREALERALMEATILMPPLYVGKADVLSVRFNDHMEGRTGFSKRFQQHVATIAPPFCHMRVTDLLFGCVAFSADIAEQIRATGSNRLLEQVIMRLARPAYSVE